VWGCCVASCSRAPPPGPPSSSSSNKTSAHRSAASARFQYSSLLPALARSSGSRRQCASANTAHTHKRERERERKGKGGRERAVFTLEHCRRARACMRISLNYRLIDWLDAIASPLVRATVVQLLPPTTSSPRLYLPSPSHHHPSFKRKIPPISAKSAGEVSQGPWCVPSRLTANSSFKGDADVRFTSARYMGANLQPGCTRMNHNENGRCKNPQGQHKPRRRRRTSARNAAGISTRAAWIADRVHLQGSPTILV